MTSDFHRTNMGHQFFEGTMPQLVRQLRRLNDNLERALLPDMPSADSLETVARVIKTLPLSQLSDKDLRTIITDLKRGLMDGQSPPADGDSAGSPAHTSASPRSDP